MPIDPVIRIRKAAASVVSIDSARIGVPTKPDGPQPPANANRFSPHKFSRRSFIAMFVVGRSVRRIARFHRVAEAAVENELRAEIALRKVA